MRLSKDSGQLILLPVSVILIFAALTIGGIGHAYAKETTWDDIRVQSKAGSEMNPAFLLYLR